MDTVGAADRRTDVRTKLNAACDAMRRAASASVLTGDPVSEQLHALAASFEALGEICEVSANAQLDIAAKLRVETDAVANAAIARVHASGLDIVEQLTPRLTAVVEQTSRARMRTARLRVIFGGLAALTVGLGFIACVSYAAGFSSGRSQGELAAHTIAAAIAAGPKAATAWAYLMANNDPVQALAACKKSISIDAQGRKFCNLPIWLEGPEAPPQ